MVSDSAPRRASHPAGAAGTDTVLVFAAAATVAAVTLTALTLGGPRVHLGGASAAVVTLALSACFAATEATRVHLELRRETVSFSLNLIPLVAGLYALNPWALVAARLIGSGATLVLHRRQRLVKLAVNLSGFCLEAAVAAAVFRALDPRRAVAASTWPALFAATSVAALVFAVYLSAAISVYQRRWEASLWSSGAAILAGAVVETSVVVISVTLLVGELARVAVMPAGQGSSARSRRAPAAASGSRRPSPSNHSCGRTNGALRPKSTGRRSAPSYAGLAMPIPGRGGDTGPRTGNRRTSLHRTAVCPSFGCPSTARSHAARTAAARGATTGARGGTVPRLLRSQERTFGDAAPPPRRLRI